MACLGKYFDKEISWVSFMGLFVPKPICTYTLLIVMLWVQITIISVNADLGNPFEDFKSNHTNYPMLQTR